VTAHAILPLALTMRLLLVRFNALYDARAEVEEFFFAHSAYMTNRLHRCGSPAGEFAERSVVEDHKCGDAALGGYFTAELAKILEDRLVYIGPGVFFDSSPG
jgi:hypothetical protein